MYLLRLFLVSWCASVLAEPLEYSLEEADQLFEEFIQKYEKIYEDETEKDKRFQIFKDNLLDVNHKNKETSRDSFVITKFMDLTDEEFRHKYTGVFSGTYDSMCTPIGDDGVPDANAPDSWDWRTQNVVTPVKNQHTCGSCYAFSSTGHLESQYIIKHRQSVSLSEQQIVDCDQKTFKCAGGRPDIVFQWLINNGGIQSEDDYPYLAVNGTCHFDKDRAVAQVTQCHYYQLTTQEKVKQLLYKKGPLSILIDATNLKNWNVNNVYDSCSDYTDHAVLLVGYGTLGNQPYWLVKNSWGDNWGNSGYFYLVRGEGITSCGMMCSFGISSADVA